MSYYERRLPHWHPDGKDLFVTWRLHGSLPASRYIPPQGLTSGQAFAWIDRYLDQARCGPTWLHRPEVARMVVETIRYGQDALHHYAVHAHVVMANHVHLLLTPLIAPAKILHSLKGFTAREANRLIHQTGKTFWQSESYDHWVRDSREFGKIAAYIENNPVRAGLVGRAEDYPWSSAGKKAGMTAGLQPGLAAPH